jgi:hypothetical protein
MTEYKAPEDFFNDVVMGEQISAQRKLNNITRRWHWILGIPFLAGLAIGVFFF